MEPIESSETSAYINTLTPGTYPKEKKLQEKNFFLKAVILSLKFNQPEPKCTCSFFPPEIKRQEREADHLPPSCADIKNGRSCNSAASVPS